MMTVEERDEWLGRHEAWWRDTNNPLHVWLAIELCLKFETTMPLPTWCLQYLAATAKNLAALTRGRDFRDSTVQVHPDDAFALSARAFGFSRQGKKNAFARFPEYSKDQQHAVTRDVYNDRERAVAEMTAERSISPERARRRLAKSKIAISQG